MQADRLGYGGALDVFGHVAVIDPFEAVAGDFPVGGFHRGDLFGVAGKGRGDAEDGDGDLQFGEQAVQAPEACARAVVVEGFHVGVALVWPRGGTCDVGQERLGCGVAVQDVVFAALLIVQNDRDGDFCAVWPGGIGRVWAVAAKIAGVAGRERII